MCVMRRAGAHSDPDCMPAGELNETLVFELPCGNQGESLCERLRPRWHVDSYDCGDVVLVAAELRPAAEDLAVLLRAVKLWALGSSIALLRFHLDGRGYVLESGLGLEHAAVTPTAA
jgi:hypothetical protein